LNNIREDVRWQVNADKARLVTCPLLQVVENVKQSTRRDTKRSRDADMNGAYGTAADGGFFRLFFL
jgi:hypothetical protein